MGRSYGHNAGIGGAGDGGQGIKLAGIRSIEAVKGEIRIGSV